MLMLRVRYVECMHSVAAALRERAAACCRHFHCYYFSLFMLLRHYIDADAHAALFRRHYVAAADTLFTMLLILRATLLRYALMLSPRRFS